MSDGTVLSRGRTVVDYDPSRILAAVTKCFASTDTDFPAEAILQTVEQVLFTWAEPWPVEAIQDVVERALILHGLPAAAKHYILYREEHARQRLERPIPDEVREAFAASDPYFPTALQQFQFYDKYSRYNYEMGRRETWIETVTRAVDYLYELAGDRLDSSVYARIKRGILKMQVTPSMRLLAMAGPAARVNNIRIYNCSYLPIVDLFSFVEGLLISMNGCGVGFSVESRYIDKLPRVKRQVPSKPASKFVVEDTTEGWADALMYGLNHWVDGYDVAFNFDELRPAGAPLILKGGQASGPEPLKTMLQFVRARILSRQGSVLRPIDAHDIMCAVGNAAVSGGVRRTAMISLFDFHDEEMLRCKSGDFERENSQRWNANNSAVWPEGGPTQLEFIKQFSAMVEGGRGEPGIFSRDVARKRMPVRRHKDYEFGTNPCGEIVLRPWELCNLSAAIARNGDSVDMLKEKVELAAIIGSIQSLATYFPGLRSQWKENCDEERLTGVDITGQVDALNSFDAGVYAELKLTALIANAETNSQLGIPHSAAVTCVKPSGNTSQLVDCSSGLHARWAPYYLKNARVSAHSPIFQVLRDAAVPMSPENGQTPENASTWVIHFPVKAPEGTLTQRDMSAQKQFEIWLDNKKHWTEHNPSVTITYKPDDVLLLMNLLWEHREYIGGMAFLPAFDAKYDLLPLVEISKEEYERRVAEFPSVDFSKLFRYEQRDMSVASQLPACEGPVCLIDQ